MIQKPSGQNGTKCPNPEHLPYLRGCSLCPSTDSAFTALVAFGFTTTSDVKGVTNSYCRKQLTIA